MPPARVVAVLFLNLETQVSPSFRDLPFTGPRYALYIASAIGASHELPTPSANPRAQQPWALLNARQKQLAQPI